MNKIIKYGVVAGLTMAAFSVAGAPVYADEPAPEPVCTVEAAATEYLYTVSNCKGGVTLQEKVSSDSYGIVAESKFSKTFDGETGNGTFDLTNYAKQLSVGEHSIIFVDDGREETALGPITITVEAEVTKGEGYVYNLSHALGAVPYYESSANSFSPMATEDYAIDVDAYGNGTLDLTKYFENKTAGDYRIEIVDTSMDDVYVAPITFTVAPTLDVKLSESSDAVDTDSVKTNIKDAEITYSIKAGDEAYAEIDADGKIAKKDVVLATDKTITVIVKAEKDDLSATKELAYTIAANYTAVEASFENGEDTIKVSGETTIVIDKVDGVEYEYDYDKKYLDIDENGKVTVKEGTQLGEDTKFLITVKATAGDEEIKSAELTLTVEKNYTVSHEEPIFAIIDGEKIEAGEPVVVEIDAPMSKLWGVVVFNKTLLEKAQSGEELTEEEQKAMVYQLGADDCEVTEGSTIITLSDAFLAKLPAGEYLLRAYFYDDSNIEDVREGYAESTFTIAATAPDTGAATAVKAGATSSVLASVLAAITAAGAAVVAKFAKRK